MSFSRVLPFENNVTWDCDGPEVHDPSGSPIEVGGVVVVIVMVAAAAQRDYPSLCPPVQ